jgi:hypothetical protein
MDAAKRYRVGTEKLEKAVAAELATKEKKTKVKESRRGFKTEAKNKRINLSTFESLKSGGVSGHTPSSCIVLGFRLGVFVSFDLRSECQRRGAGAISGFVRIE